jgi:DNA-binding IclR family transcriptional regulator
MPTQDQNAFLRIAVDLSTWKGTQATFSIARFVKEADVPASVLVVALVSLIQRELVKEAGHHRYALTVEGIAEAHRSKNE